MSLSTAVVAPKGGSLSSAIVSNNGDRFGGIVQGKQFNNLMDGAYSNSNKFKIGTVNGEKTMAVAGTHNLRNWAQNGIDTYAAYRGTKLGKKFNLGKTLERGLKYVGARNKRANARDGAKIARFAHRDGVKNVIGHSRGSLRTSYAQNYNKNKGRNYAAVDGAMLITPNKRLFNYHTKSIMDRGLAYSGKNNYRAKKSKTFSLSKNNIHWSYKL